ncbi:Murein peptide amidase A [Dyadobacter sp. CECT 9275]|uniref:Murein peptide amidase A n=1 Tax=Dyadobacter helix TaxID=2822344 RepID=A0A916NC83_9BACT|nr:M14 family metallopeptidase [Dyadobacter sp. CECT 9275]CAG5000221.1 Murein peptide amidase A [Dyadobacter sp. CECT 9275]
MTKSQKQLVNRRGFMGLAGLSVSSMALPSILKENITLKQAPSGKDTTDNYRTLREGNVFFDGNKVVVTAYKSMRFFKKEFSHHFAKMRIYRMECPDFKYGTDYGEYFPAQDYKKADLIFHGKMEPLLDCKFHFEDTTAKIGSTYSYWIGTDEGEPEGPLAVKVRDPEVWYKYEQVQEKVALLQKKYPAMVNASQIGLTTYKRPLMGLKVGHGKKCIAVVGAVHAGEAGPEIILYMLEKLLENHQDLLKKVSIVAIPSANPDMRDRLVRGNPWYLRRNPNLVDINRNFPANWDTVETTYGYSTDDPQGNTYRGLFSNSENETMAISSFMKKHKPKLLLSYHCLASIAGETLAASKDALQNQAFVDRSDNYARMFWEAQDYRDPKQEKVIYMCTAGSIPTWGYKELDMPAYDVEAPFDAADLAKCKLDQTDRELLRKYQEKHLKGMIALLKGVNAEKK